MGNADTTDLDLSGSTPLPAPGRCPTLADTAAWTAEALHVRALQERVIAREAETVRPSRCAA